MFDMENVYAIYRPKTKAVPVIASIPHSGTYLPDNVRLMLKDDIAERLPSTDWYVDELYDFLPRLGVTVLKAEFSRYTVDVNRPLSASRYRHQDRSFQSHPILVTNAFGDGLYKDGVSWMDMDVDNRLLSYYVPYHDQLRALLKKTVRDFGVAYLLDLHSFTYNIDAHVCLGTDGSISQSSAPKLHRVFQEQCRHIPLKTVSNRVFYGGHITRNTRTMDNVEAMQIEILKGCYLEEGHNRTAYPKKAQPNFDRLRHILYSVCERSIGQIRLNHSLSKLSL